MEIIKKEIESKVVIDEDLDNILDDTLEEIKEEEELLKELEEEEMQVSNNQLYKTLLELNESFITAKREELIVDNKIFRAIEKVADISNSINGKYNKTTSIVMVILFVLGVLIGMQYETWIPYVSNILDFARTATNVVKG